MNRAEAGRLGGLTTHATRDSYAHLAPARSAFRARFEQEVDPDGLLPADERERRADRAMRAHMLRLAAKSAEKRKRATA